MLLKTSCYTVNIKKMQVPLSLAVAVAKFFSLARIVVLTNPGETEDSHLFHVNDASSKTSIHIDLLEAQNNSSKLDIATGSVVLDNFGIFKQFNEEKMFIIDRIWLLPLLQFDKLDAPQELQLDSNFIVAEGHDGTFDLVEWYRVSGRLLSTDFGTWGTEQGLAVPIPFIWNRRENLHGVVLTIGSSIGVS